MISVVIPHYGDKNRLFSNLKTNVPFLKDYEVIIVNDYPDIRIKDEISRLFPDIFVIENEKNLGFSGSASLGINNAKNPYILLLNNDVILLNNSFQKALKHFKENRDIFAVSFCQIEKDGRYVGKNVIYWLNGFFRHSKGNSQESGFNGWAEGGSMLFDKKKYELIGGFDTTYSPFYWEDIDLSYRAWKAGFSIYFDSSIIVKHFHESSIGKYFKKSKIYSISYRNQLITIWKNISNNYYFLEHLMFLFKTLILSPFKDRGSFIWGFMMAIALLPDIIKKRSEQKKLWKLKDVEIFEKFKKNE